MVVKIVLNDLYDYENMKIYQMENGFKFSLDSLLLAEFVDVKSKRELIVDFCSGNAVVPLVLSTKHVNKMIGVELQPKIALLAEKSVLINKKSNIKIINDDVKNIFLYFQPESVDIITCNPPYFKINSESLVNENQIKAIARHEIKIKLEELISIASNLLKNNGYFYLVHRTERLEEIIELLNKNKMRIKIIQFVYSNNHKESSLVLIKALKNGKMGMKVNPPIYTDNLSTFQNIF